MSLARKYRIVPTSSPLGLRGWALNDVNAFLLYSSKLLPDYYFFPQREKDMMMMMISFSISTANRFITMFKLSKPLTLLLLFLKFWIMQIKLSWTWDINWEFLFLSHARVMWICFLHSSLIEHKTISVSFFISIMFLHDSTIYRSLTLFVVK